MSKKKAAKKKAPAKKVPGKHRRKLAKGGKIFHPKGKMKPPKK